MLFQRFQVLLNRIVDADVDHLKAGAFHHHGDQILADIVDVALDRADHHLADRFGTGFRQQRAQHLHPALHGVGRRQHLRHKQNTVSKIHTDDCHTSHQRFVQHLGGRPTPCQQNLRALDNFITQAVVHIVENLFHQLIIGKAREIQLFIIVQLNRIAHRANLIK